MTEPLKVCFVCSSAGTMAGGIETIATQLANQIAKRGHEVYFITGTQFRFPFRHELFDLPNEVITVPYLSLKSKLVKIIAKLFKQAPINLQSLNFCFSVLGNQKALLSLISSDLVVTFLEGEAVLFSRYLKKRSLPVIYYMPGCVDWRWLKKDQSIIRLTCSKWFMDFCKNTHNFELDGYIHPGAPEQLLNLAPLKVKNAKDLCTLIYVGRLENNKGVSTVLSLFAALEPAFPKLRLKFVGDGPLTDALKQEVKNLNLKAKVDFTGVLAPTRVHDELCSADIFLFPSEYETFGLSVVEAMASGLPVVASNHPVLKEATNATAILLPVGKTQLWLDTLKRLIHDPGERKQVSQKQRNWVKGLRWHQAAEKFEPYFYLALKKFYASRKR